MTTTVRIYHGSRLLSSKEYAYISPKSIQELRTKYEAQECVVKVRKNKSPTEISKK